MFQYKAMFEAEYCGARDLDVLALAQPAAADVRAVAGGERQAHPARLSPARGGSTASSSEPYDRYWAGV